MSNGRKLANLIVGTNFKVTNVDSDLANTISSIKTRLDSDDAKLQSLDTAIAAGLLNLADSDLIISQLEAKISSAVTNVDSDSAAIQAANTQIEIIKARLDSDSIKLQSISTEISSEIAATNTDILSIKSRLDSDDTKLQSLDTTISGLVSRLDSDEIAIQAGKTLVNSATAVAGMADSDLKVVADLRNQLDSEILSARNLHLSYTNYNYNATAGQTTFTGSDANSLTLAYVVNTIQVFLNGVLLEAADYTATNGTSIVLTEGAQASAQLTIIVAKAKSTYIMIVNWSTVTKQQKLVNTDFNAGTQSFANQVDLAGDYALVSAQYYDDAGYTNNGAVFVFIRSGSTWSQQTKLTTSTKRTQGQLGRSIALNEDATEVLLGSNGADNTTVGIYSFTRVGTTWTQGQKIDIPAGVTGANGTYHHNSAWGQYGNLVRKGNYFAVGAKTDEGNGSSTYKYGSAWVYNKGTSTTLYGASYDSVTSQVLNGDVTIGNFPGDTSTTSILFNANGTKLYLTGYNTDTVYQFSLSTAYDITASSLSYDDVSFNVNGGGVLANAPFSMKWNNDGTKLFVLNMNSKVFEYNLSTPYDVSTMSYNNVVFSTASEDSSIRGFGFSNDGTKMFLGGGTAPEKIYMYNLSSAWDLSTASYSNTSYSYPISGAPADIIFNSNGSKMFVMTYSVGIREFELSTPYDITTVGTYSQTLSTGPQDSQVYSFTFNGDMSKIYLIGAATEKIFQYSTGGAEQWLLQQELVPSDDSDAAGSKEYGTSLSMPTDSMVAVGAPFYEPIDGYRARGAVYIFTRAGTTWTETQKITGPINNLLFGSNVTIHGDYMAISAPGHVTNGIVYIYKNISGTWTYQTSLTASDAPTYVWPGVKFGQGLMMTTDANNKSVLVVGSPNHITSGSANSSSYIFTRSGSTWSEDKIINTSDTESGATVLGGQGVGGIAINKDTTKNDLILGSVNNGAYVFTV